MADCNSLYSPTEDKEEEDKDSSYEEQQTAVEETQIHDVLFILGDLLAKLAQTTKGTERIHNGKTWLWCDEQQLYICSRLVDFCK